MQTKRKLLDDCDLWCIVSLPAGVFSQAGAGVKTNLLFFTKGSPTERIWYYDLRDIKVGKKTPFTLERIGDFFELVGTSSRREGRAPGQRAQLDGDARRRSRPGTTTSRPSTPSRGRRRHAHA